MSEILHLYDDKELSKILRVNEATLRRWRYEKKIPYTLVRTRVRYTEEQLHEILRAVPAEASR